jgi:hypothetical protein
MGRGLHESLFVNHVAKPGIAVTGMKLFTYLNSGNPGSLIHSTVLFGDPAMSLRLPAANQAPSPASGQGPTAVTLADMEAAAPAHTFEFAVLGVLTVVLTLCVTRRRWYHPVWAADTHSVDRPEGMA